jgi:hypothetical protein
MARSIRLCKSQLNRAITSYFNQQKQIPSSKFPILGINTPNSRTFSSRTALHTLNMADPRTAVVTKDAPGFPSLLSQAIVANGVVYCSGNVALDVATGEIIDGDIKAHTVRQLDPKSELSSLLTKI